MTIDYTEIYNTYKPKLKVLFNKQVKDKDEVEDLIQEVMIKVLNNLEAFDDTHQFSTWIYSIAFNTLKNYYRDSKHFVTYSKEIYDNEHTLSLDNPESIMISNEIEDNYFSLLNDLDQKYLDVYLFREVDSLSYKDIADKLDISVGSVKSRLHRAREYINDKLER